MSNYDVIKRMNADQIAELLIAVDNKEISYNKMNCNDCVSYCRPDCNECWKWWMEIDAYTHPQGLQHNENERFDIGEVEHEWP